jgi:hypothetical protein
MDGRRGFPPGVTRAGFAHPAPHGPGRRACALAGAVYPLSRKGWQHDSPFLVETTRESVRNRHALPAAKA